jgi:hypothetical protein
MGVKRRYDFEMTKECVWIEISVRVNYSLLVGKHYFAPEVKSIGNNLNFLEVNLNSHLCRAVLLGGFNVPNYD